MEKYEIEVSCEVLGGPFDDSAVIDASIRCYFWLNLGDTTMTIWHTTVNDVSVQRAIGSQREVLSHPGCRPGDRMIPSRPFSSDPRNFPYLQCAPCTDKVKRGREEMLSHLYILRVYHPV